MKITKRVDVTDVYVSTKLNDTTEYLNLCDDTTETIDILNNNLREHTEFQSKEEIWNWFKQTLYLHGKKNKQFPSLYRAYICLQTDEIFELRISDHNSNTDTTQDSWDDRGTPSIVSHLTIEKVPLNDTNLDEIDKDRNLNNVPIIVDEFSIEEFNDKTKRGKKIDEIIDILENGTKAESFKNRNKKPNTTSKTNECSLISLRDYITEQKHNTIYKMKSLNEYISENKSDNQNIQFIDVSKWKTFNDDGTDEKGKDGEYICWYVQNKETKELAFWVAKYVFGGRGSDKQWISQENCEKLLGKPKGYFDKIKE